MDLQKLHVLGPSGRLAGWTTGPIAPDRPPVLFIHPINMRGHIWADVVKRLDPARTCLLPDLRAHGESDQAGEFGLEAWASDCVAVLDHQRISGPVHLVGASLGGGLACVLAAKHPDRVLSVTAIGSSLDFRDVDAASVLAMFDALGVSGTFRKVFPVMTFAPGCSPAVIERGIALANPNDIETVKRVWYATITSDASPYAEAVRVPALVITGEHDATCTPAKGLDLARALRTEQTIMPGIGHMPMLEAPDRLADLIGRHLGRVEGHVASSPHKRQ